MRNRQHEGLLRGIVRQRDDAAPFLQKSEDLPVPAALLLDEVPETMSLRGQFFNLLVILYTRTIEIRFLRRNFDRQVNITQSLGLGFQHAAEENHPRYLAKEVRVAIDRSGRCVVIRQGLGLGPDRSLRRSRPSRLVHCIQRPDGDLRASSVSVNRLVDGTHRMLGADRFAGTGELRGAW
jgi:hypothetical protein